MGQWEEEEKLSHTCSNFKERLPASSALDFSSLRQTDLSPRGQSFFRETPPFTWGLVLGLYIMGPSLQHWFVGARPAPQDHFPTSIIDVIL